MKKKSTNIIIAQSSSELKFIVSKFSNFENFYCVPVNLSTQLYCIERKIPYLNPLEFVSNGFHKEALSSSEAMISKINFKKNYNFSEKNEIKTFLRFYFNSLIFLIEIFDNIKHKFKINKIYVSGWLNYKATYSKDNYYISFLIKNLFINKVVELDKSNKQQLLKSFNKKYSIIYNKIPSDKKIIVLTNLGYNFFRIFKYLFKNKKKYIFLSPYDYRIGFFKKIILNFLGIKFFSFKEFDTLKKISIKLPKIFFKFRNKYNLSKLLNFRIEQEKNNLLKNKQRYIALKNYLNKKKIVLILSNNSKNQDGQILDYGYQNNIPIFCIPHGTVSKYFNKFDRLYKKIISESITYPHSIFIAQSKIAASYYEQEKKIFKGLNSTGNIIFAERDGGVKKKNNKILYAVTMKDFDNIQYLGVEMYYEYLDNISLLNNLAKKHDLDIIIKNHPSIEIHSDSLKKQFTNLSFTNHKIQKILNETNLTISFSSTVIEDSLYNLNPVILFDKWQRYQHCSAEKNPNLKNKAVYYVNKEEDLLKCIYTVFNSKKIKFNEYVIPGSSIKNISKLLKKY